MESMFAGEDISNSAAAVEADPETSNLDRIRKGLRNSAAAVEADPETSNLDQIRKSLRNSARERLASEIKAFIRILKKPLADIIRDHALAHLPAMSLHRFCAVSKDWNRHITAPLFPYANAAVNRSISGVFFSSWISTPCFAPFDPRSDSVPDPTLSFLPHRSGLVTAESSSHGLLCVSGPRGGYYVCNPATAEWAAIPSPTVAEGASVVGAVIVFEPDVYNFRADYDLVVAFKVGGVKGIYSFETFSSAAGAWWTSPDVLPVEEIISSSGVSAGGKAWWRTSMQTAIGFDPTTNSIQVVPWPAEYDVEAVWQLGAIDNQLCCTVVSTSTVTVHAWEPTNRWSLLGSFPIGTGRPNIEESNEKAIMFEERPWPLRFQSGNPEVLLALGEQLIGVDLARRRVREIQFSGSRHVNTLDFVPHINTLVRVFPSPVDDAMKE